MRCPLLLSLFALLASTNAQTVYNPPDASSGTSATNGTSPNPQWATVLGNSLWFYEAQRSGKLPANNRVSWRNDSEVDDGSEAGLDLSGGYYDAGDYIKAMYPMSFSIFSIAWAGISSGSGFDQTNQTGYLDSMLRWGLDWMIKMHPQNETLYVQVGSTEVDNAYWGGDQGIPSPRTCYQVNSSAPGTDVAASTSAAFAIAALLYSNPSMNATTTIEVAYQLSSTSASLANASYAATLLSHAESLYLFANNTLPFQTYQTDIPAMADAYASSSFGDDLCLAALALALATNRSSYYTDALGHYERYKLSGSQAVLNWDSKTPAAYLLFVQAAISRPSLAQGAGVANNLTGWQAEMERYLDQIVNVDLDSARLTAGGLLYYEGDSNSASLNPAVNAAVLLMRYAPMASVQDKADTYEAFAQSQINYLMGKNPMNSVYVVGSHPNSPQNPHSGMAAGGNDIANIRTSPPVTAHVLYGAVVGGPLESDKFWDYRDDWVQNEIAIDYNAPLVALAAMMVEGSVDPYYTAVQAGTYSVPEGQPCDQALPCAKSGGLSEAAKIGIAVAVVVVVLAILLGIAWWKRDGIRRWWRSAGEKKA